MKVVEPVIVVVGMIVMEVVVSVTGKPSVFQEVEVISMVVVVIIV